MSDPTRPRPIHVERTADPAVMRWVLNHPGLRSAERGERQAPPSSPLGRLKRNSAIVEVELRNGDAFIRASDSRAWPTIADEVRTAIIGELDDLDDGTATWLLEPTDRTEGALSIEDAQRVVDRAAGAAMRAHGGAMVVTAVGRSALHLRAEGACHGCSRSDETLLALIRPAIRAADPNVVDVIVGDACTSPSSDGPAPSSPVRMMLARRRRRPSLSA